MSVWGTRRVTQILEYILASSISVVYPRVTGSMVAMTKPVSRDAKLKGLKESTDRALVNCASGKYRSRPIKPMSLDMSLEHWCRAKVRPLQVLVCSFAASKVHSLGASARLFLSCAAHGKGWE